MPQITSPVKNCFVTWIFPTHAVVIKWQLGFISTLGIQHRFANICLPMSGSGPENLSHGMCSFVKRYLDPCLEAFSCTQFMVNIDAGVKIFDETIQALRKNFDCSRQSCLKLSADNCDFRTQKRDYLGCTITCRGVSRKDAKKVLLTSLNAQHFETSKTPDWRVQIFRKVILEIGQNCNHLLRTKNAFTISNDHHVPLNTLKVVLIDAKTSRPAKRNQVFTSSSFVMLVFDAPNLREWLERTSLIKAAK